MSYLDTPHKKKSAVLTTVIMVLLVFLIFNFGMKYLDPPEEYGIAINFGTSNVGSGDVQSEPDSGAPQEEVVEEEVVEEQVEEIEPIQEAAPEPITTPTKAEDVVTQDNAETIRINKQKEAKRKADEAERKVKEAERQAKLKAERIKKQKEAAEAKKRAAAAKKKREQDAKRKGIDGLLNGLNKGKGKGKGGEGNDNQSGDKGQLDGNPYGNSYFGSGSGRGNGSGYGLNGRKLVNKGRGFKQNCNEYGTVVVKIEVNKSGRVIRATPGVKGSTNTAPCLMGPAKKSALSFKWNLDSKAPTKQIGFVIVKFN